MLQLVEQETARLSSEHQLGEMKREYSKWNRSNPYLVATVQLLSILISGSMFFIHSTLYIVGFCGLFVSVIFCLTYWTKYPYHHSRHFLYEHGLLLIICKHEQIIGSEAIHWRDIATIWHTFSYNSDADSKSESYTLHHCNGDVFGSQTRDRKQKHSRLPFGHVNNSRYPDSPRSYAYEFDVALGKQIEQLTLPYLLPQAFSTYRQGFPVHFGPLTLHIGGIEYQDKLLPWHELGRSYLVESPSTDKAPEALYFLEKADQSSWRRPYWAVVTCSEVPNFALLRWLIFSMLDAPYPISCVPLVAGKTVTIMYKGYLVANASSITMHWGYNNWNSITETGISKQPNGIWSVTITIPSGATMLNIAFYNQSHTWDNNNSDNYNLGVL